MKSQNFNRAREKLICRCSGLAAFKKVIRVDVGNGGIFMTKVSKKKIFLSQTLYTPSTLRVLTYVSLVAIFDDFAKYTR